MGLLHELIEAFTKLWPSRQSIPGHTKQQAYGRRWSRHRPRRIGTYSRRRPQRG